MPDTFPRMAGKAQPPHFYSSRDVREMFGTPGRPISLATLKRYRDSGVGPINGEPVARRLPFVQINRTNYRYPKAEIDRLIATLCQIGRKSLGRKSPTT